LLVEPDSHEFVHPVTGYTAPRAGFSFLLEEEEEGRTAPRAEKENMLLGLLWLLRLLLLHCLEWITEVREDDEREKVRGVREV
jgi:hypothetical protein